MADLHPFFVHFPIALLVVAALFDVFGAFRNTPKHRWTAYVLQLMAGVAVIFAAITGNLAENAIAKQAALHQGVRESFERHVSLGNLMVWIIILLVVGRSFAVLEKKDWAFQGWIFPSISLVLALLVLVTGLLGGELSHNILQYFINK